MDDYVRRPNGPEVADPWSDALALGAWQPEEEPPRAPVRDGGSADVYRQVQRGAAFQRVRRGYRRFAFPATGAFLVWYLLYVITVTSAPGLMGRRVVGVVNVAMVAGLAQFLTTFVLAWAYARHARLRRDRAALELRWDTQERIR